jgi:hypothetical protein
MAIHMGGRHGTESSVATFSAAGSATGVAAVQDAVGAAVDGLGDGPPGLVLVFPTGQVEPTLAALHAREAAGGAPVVGMSSNGALAAPLDDGPGCSALAFDDSLLAGVGVAEHASRDLRAAGRVAAQAACAAVDPEAEHALLLLFVDPASGDQSEAVDGAYEATGPAVQFAGGGAGGRAGVQFAHDAARRDSVVAALVVSPGPIGLGIAQACVPVNAPSIVTRAEGRTVLELDGRPADEVYAEKLGYPRDVGDAELRALAVMHPLAQPELSGDVRLRHVFGRAPGGGLAVATPISPNAAVVFTEQTVDAILESAGEAVGRALAGLDGAEPRGVLAFDCAGRKQALGGAVEEETNAIRLAVGEDVPLAGAFTHGEVGRARGAKGDRNHALVVVAFG